MPNVLEIPISGTNPVKHITVITMTPQWSESMETTFNTQTTILETLSGKESRTARLYRPLVGIDFVGIAADQAEHQLYKAIFERWSETGIYAVPLWMDAVNLDADITADETHRVQTFSANGFNRLFRWFRYALLWQSPEHCQVIEIKRLGKSGSGNNQIVCRSFEDAKVKMSFNKDDFLVPLALGSISQPDREFLTNAINTIQISFTEKQGAVGFYNGSNESDSLEYYLTYRPKLGNEQNPDSDSDVEYPDDERPDRNYDYTQFTLMPNWDLAENIYREQDDVYFDALDGGLAKPYIINNKNKLKISLGYTVDRTQLQDIIKFFEYHDGCKGSFLVPTWTADFPEGETPTDYFVVKDDLSVEYMGQSAYNGNDVQFFCKAVMCRFAEDTLEVKALTNNLYEVVCNFVQCACAEHYVDVGGGNTELVGQDIIDKAVYLYELQKNGSATVNRYANYGYGVSANGNNYAAADIAFSEIVKDVEALDNKIEVTCSGLDAVISLNMRVEIKKGTIDSNGTITNVSTIFKGIVTKLSTEANGARLLDVESNLYTFDNDVPRIKLQRQCNWQFGDIQCGISNNKKVVGKSGDADTGYYIYITNNIDDYSLFGEKHFLPYVTIAGRNYEVITSEILTSLPENIDIDASNVAKLYKIPLGVPSGEHYPVALYTYHTQSIGIGSQRYDPRLAIYSAYININGYDFQIKGYDNINQLSLSQGVTISAANSSFIGKVFSLQLTDCGKMANKKPLRWIVQNFYAEESPVSNRIKYDHKMACILDASYFAGMSENEEYGYLPSIGSTVKVNGVNISIHGYIHDSTQNGSESNYLLATVEDNATSSIANRTLNNWTILNNSQYSIQDCYILLKAKVSQDAYNAVSVGDDIVLKRYCNKQISCCKECYNNVARFGGFPFLPNNTPYEYTQNTSSGKK